ncbi:acetylserotonin O-methyltransferase [Callospermophilus lateralis]
MGSALDPAFRLLQEHAHGFMVSQVLFAACELGLFDLLAEAPGPLDLAAISEGLGASPRGTELLLAACVPLRLLDVDTRGGTARYANSELARAYLTSRSPTGQRTMLRYLGSTTYRCWAHLADAVRQGSNQYLRAFGVPAGDLFAAIYRSPAERLQFTRGLQEIWSVDGRRVLTAFDLSPFRTVCDLGGDFFEDPLPEADLYILARVLHDWSDETCSRLLARVHHACRPGGGVLVVERVLDADGRGPLATLLGSLNMLLQAEGRERTAAQFHALLADAGFGGFALRRTGGVHDAILATKALP